MHTEQKQAVVIFEDSPIELQLLQAYLPNSLHLVIIQRFAESEAFVESREEQEQLLDGAIVIAFLVDGNISPGAFNGLEGATLIRKIRENTRFAQALVIGNTGGTDIPGADAQLGKNSRKKRTYLPEIVEIHQKWLETHEVSFDVE